MAAPSFDPTHAVRFDLPRGSVRTRGDDDRVLLVPIEALDGLLMSAPQEAAETLGRALGAAVGRRAAVRMGDPQDASIDAFVTQLAGEAAVAGIGALSVERWGHALVVVIDDSPLVGTLLAAFVASALEAATGRRAHCTLLARDHRTVRILVGSERSIARAREWIASGVRWSEAIVKLHGGGA
jgi:hypothetical protein